MGFYTQHKDDAHVFIPKEYWPSMPKFDSSSDEADAIKRMFRNIVQDYAKVSLERDCGRPRVIVLTLC